MAKKIPKSNLLPHIQFDRNVQMGAYHDDPLAFMLHERFFNDFLLVTNTPEDWLYESNFSGKTASLNISNKLNRQQHPLHSRKFVELAKEMPRRKFITYSPLDPPYRLNPLTYLMNSPTIAHAYENKRYFRDEFSDLIRMPQYLIKHIHELDKAASYKELRQHFGSEAFVLQDEESHGSRGTYIVHNVDEYADAVSSLKKNSLGRSIVVSEFIKGRVASIQVCITKYGIFSAGVQKQIIGSKYLCNERLDSVAKWCGGELGGDTSEIVVHQAQEIATIVGSELASHGYKGIFGVDIMITPSKEVYAIEINARHTGYSHLISDMQLKEGKIPFLLLHALELGNIPYEVTDLDALPSGATYKKPVSYMIIHNSLDESFELKKEIKNGLYLYKDGKISFIKAAYSISDLTSDGSTFLISTFWSKGETVDRGRRILKITKHGKCLTKNDLNPKNQELVLAIKKHFALPK
jgi:hypothetical protein